MLISCIMNSLTISHCMQGKLHFRNRKVYIFFFILQNTKFKIHGWNYSQFVTKLTCPQTDMYPNWYVPKQTCNQIVKYKMASIIKLCLPSKMRRIYKFENPINWGFFKKRWHVHRYFLLNVDIRTSFAICIYLSHHFLIIVIISKPNLNKLPFF